MNRQGCSGLLGEAAGIFGLEGWYGLWVFVFCVRGGWVIVCFHSKVWFRDCRLKLDSCADEAMSPQDSAKRINANKKKKKKKKKLNDNFMLNDNAPIKL